MSRVGLNFYKLNNNMQFSVIVALVFAVLAGFLPNYERAVYSMTEPVEWFEARNYTGFPAGDGVPELESREEILKEGEGFTLAVDAGSLEPLHFFLGLSEDAATDSALLRFLNSDDNKKAFGQLFSVELENGDTVIVLLDDQAVKLPRSGTVRLPIGETKKPLSEDAIEYLTAKYDFSEDELTYYVDMAGNWRKSSIARRIVTVRSSVAMAVFIPAVIGTYLLIGRIERKEREHMQQERSEREREYRRKREEGQQDVYQEKL